MTDNTVRYDICDREDEPFMESCEDGDWVNFADYAARTAERDALRAALERIAEGRFSMAPAPDYVTNPAPSPQEIARAALKAKARASTEPAPVSVREAARVWFVAAVAQKGDRCGYRMLRVEADGEEHAIGLAMKVFKELEPDWSFAEPAALRAIAEGKEG